MRTCSGGRAPPHGGGAATRSRTRCWNHQLQPHCRRPACAPRAHSMPQRRCFCCHRRHPRPASAAAGNPGRKTPPPTLPAGQTPPAGQASGQRAGSAPPPARPPAATRATGTAPAAASLRASQCRPAPVQPPPPVFSLSHLRPRRSQRAAGPVDASQRACHARQHAAAPQDSPQYLGRHLDGRVAAGGLWVHHQGLQACRARSRQTQPSPQPGGAVWRRAGPHTCCTASRQRVRPPTPGLQSPQCRGRKPPPPPLPQRRVAHPPALR